VPRAGTDAGLLDVIDRAMADAKTEGADYARQIQAAVETLDKIRRQREEVDRKAEAARQQVVAAVTQKAEKSFQDDLAKAERDAVAAQQATLSAAVKAAEEARRKALANAAEQAHKASEATAAEARKRADEAAGLLLAQAGKQADEVRKRDLAAANDLAAESYRNAMADAEKAAEAMRLRMIEVARVNADKQLQSTLSDAKRTADERASAVLAKAQKEAEAKKAKDMAVLESRLKTDEAKRLEAAKQEAVRKYEAAVALAQKQADAERDRILADAKKAAEVERQAQIAKLAPTPAVKPRAAEAAVSAADLGLGENIPADLRRVIDAAMANAKKKGEGREGQMRAALQAIKDHRKNEASPAAVAAGGAAGSPVGVAVAKPELKEIIEIAMTRARSEGKSYQSQVQAALDAVKLYRNRETQDAKSPEADKAETSALLLGQSQADPELQRIIVDAMTQARAKGEDYAGQIRAALAAIKAHRARTAGVPKK
jgi:hypothetical protein